MHETTAEQANTYLTTTEVSAKLRTPEPTLAWWRHVGRGPEWFKVGRRVLYRSDALDRWIGEQQAAARRPA